MNVLVRNVLYLEIAQIECDAELQARVGLTAEVVKEYAQQMAAGATFPPVLVFVRPEACSLVDGFHRMAARQLLGFTTVLAETREGTREEAVWYGLTVNQKHGLRRSNDDKHRCVVKALTHPRAQLLSDRQLASHCGVHHYTVSRIRQQLERSQAIEVRDTRIVTRGGVSYHQRRLRVPTAPVAGDPSTPMQLARRLESVSTARAETDGHERVRQLIRQAHRKLDEALRAVSQCDPDRKLKSLSLHLTHLRQELSAAEDRLTQPTARAL